MKKRRNISIMMCLMMLLILVISGCTIFPEEETALEPPIVLPKEISYRTKEAVMGDIQRTTKVSGEVVPIEIEYQFVTLKGSRLEEILVNLGQHVEAGDPVVQFVTNDLEDQIEVAEMRFNMSQNDYNTALELGEINERLDEISLTGLDGDILALTDDLNEDKTDQLAYYSEQISGLEEAYEAVIRNYDIRIMQQEWNLYLEEHYRNYIQRTDTADIAELTLEDTRINYEIDLEDALERITDMQAERADYLEDVDNDHTEMIEELSISIEEQQLRVEQNLLNRLNGLNDMGLNLEIERMSLNAMYEDLEESVMRASIEGDIVFIREMEEGDYINDYDKLIGIADESDYQVEYTGSDASAFNLGMTVSITYELQTYIGSVVLTAESVPEEQRDDYRNMIMFAFVELPEDIQRGSNVSVVAIQEEARNIVIIPKSALFYSGDDVIVYVLEDGVRKERYVEVGIENSTEAEIVDGIEAGDLIIIN